MRPPGGYKLAVIDPPWHFKAGQSARHAGSKYRLMGLDDLKAMPIRDLMAKDSLIVLWALNPMEPQAFEVLAAWGAKFITGGVWSKRSKPTKKRPQGALAFGAGFWIRCSGEPWKLAKFGRPRVFSRNIRSVIEATRRDHSRKPDEAYAEFARLIPPGLPKIEVFSRENREGWDVFGDEVGKFDAG
jgi:N6-adenosine-specific RNA methylase IME4